MLRLRRHPECTVQSDHFTVDDGVFDEELYKVRVFVRSAKPLRTHNQLLQIRNYFLWQGGQERRLEKT